MPTFSALHRVRVKCALLVAVLVLLATPPILSGCAQPEPTAGPVSIVFAHIEYDGAYYQAMAREFQKANPHITITLQPRKATGFSNVQPQSPTEADVMCSALPLADLEARGALLDLDLLMALDRTFDSADFNPGALELCTRQGRTWGLPAWIDLRVVYYNKDIFDQRQVPYPKNDWTWDDFMRIAAQLRNPADEVFGFAHSIKSAEPWFWVFHHGGRLVDDWRNPTRMTLDDPKTVAALDSYAQLAHSRGVAPTMAELRQAGGGDVQKGYYTLLWLGKVGMWTGDLTERGGANWPWRWDSRFRWGAVPLPRDTGAATPVYANWSYVIFASSSHPEACWQWIAFLSRQARCPGVPVRRSVAQSADYERQVGADLAALVRDALTHAQLYPREPPDYSTRAAFAFRDALEDVMERGGPAREALIRAQANAEK